MEKSKLSDVNVVEIVRETRSESAAVAARTRKVFEKGCIWGKPPARKPSRANKPIQGDYTCSASIITYQLCSAATNETFFQFSKSERSFLHLLGG